jgi:hypothetical protein
MLKYLPVIAAFLLLLSGAHAAALDWLGNPEGKAGEADGFKNDATLYINSTKFEDLNGNGRFDDGELGLSGWVIRLKLNGVDISNTTTDESGRYSFTNLEPGKYTVVEDQQAGWEQSVPGSGYYTINLTDESADKIDFGSPRFSKAPEGNDVKADQDVVPKFTIMPSDPRIYQEDQERYERLPPAYITPDYLNT